MPSWWLEDADGIAEKCKYTFYKPSRELIKTVKPGEIVKIIFQFESDDPDTPRAERMWVLVSEVIDGEIFKGILDNEPIYIQDLKFGDLIEFKACHIINTEHDDNNNLVERYAKRCFVTKKILDETLKVGYLYRENTDEDNDSGWRITSNTESEEYMNSSNNMAYVSIGVVLNNDDSFIHLLNYPEGTAFVRDHDTGEFYAV